MTNQDNYSWLDSLMDAIFFKSNLAKVEAKQTLISQIEIEKLRANIELLKDLLEKDTRIERRIVTDITGDGVYEDKDHSYVSEYETKERIANLQEKLKELEGKYYGFMRRTWI